MAPFQMMVICEMLIKLDTLPERLKKKKKAKQNILYALHFSLLVINLFLILLFFIKPDVKYNIPLSKSNKNEISSRETIRLRINCNWYEKYF